MKKGFSIVEVLFAVMFLTLVGLAMSSLNSAMLNLVSATELKTSAYALNDEALSFIALQKRTLPSSGAGSFATTYASCIDGNQICYVNCPLDVTQACVLSPTRQAIQLGDNRLQYSRQVTITTVTTGQYLVKATTGWGSGQRRQVSSSQVID